MKTIVIASALIAAVSAPAFAQSQLERNLGVEAGAYTATQLVALKTAADQDGEGRTVFFGADNGVNISSANVTNPRAAAILESIRLAGDEGARGAAKSATAGATYVSSKGTTGYVYNGGDGANS